MENTSEIEELAKEMYNDAMNDGVFLRPDWQTLTPFTQKSFIRLAKLYRRKSPESRSEVICNCGIRGCKEHRTESSELDEFELYRILSEYAVLPTHAVNIPEQRRELSRFICTKLGTQPSKLVPINFEELRSFMKETHGEGSVSDVCRAICLKYGTPSVPSFKDIRNSFRDVAVPYADPQTGRINLIKYIDDLSVAIRRLITNSKEEK